MLTAVDVELEKSTSKSILIEHPLSQILISLKHAQSLIADRGQEFTQAIEQNGFLQTVLVMVSVFNDLCKGRTAGDALSKEEALQKMIIAVPDLFDAYLLGCFMDILGLYPLDSVVELDSGELGLVVEVDQFDPGRPTLRVVTDTQKQLLAQAFVLKLAEPAARKYSIVRVLPVDEPILGLIFSHLGQIDS